jgi:beta-N-acetylhexosaminidase
MGLGPILIGIAGVELDAGSREQLLHPAVGGVVLFTRNFENREQICELVEQIRGLRNPRLLVCIDQEGGRVQRLREEFTILPPLGKLGDIFSSNPDKAMDLTYRHARVMAAEMLACGIDLSFAPVLDLDRGSSVIGDRSFSGSVETVVDLGRAYLAGMHDAGMKTTGKHYPGHGSVLADSHVDDVTDPRPLDVLEAEDLVPFMELSADLDSLMIAHVIYPQVDDVPAGYSRKWLIEDLREKRSYQGVIMSDDLGMHAAHVAGDLRQRTQLCLDAGCDLVLVCRPEDVTKLLGQTDLSLADVTSVINSLYGESRLSHTEMIEASNQGVGEWRQWQNSLAQMNNPPGDTTSSNT